MSKVASASDGIKAVVASFGAFLQDTLARAESVKPTSAIEPALDKSDFPELQAQLSQALGPELIQTDDSTDPKKFQRFAVIETAVRDTFGDLIVSFNMNMLRYCILGQFLT